ncbi:hypothetical protein EGW08_021610 [Elysia chlorotica]|uniref:PLA2c domain-containing protein n=1 Tax=Elysia chlorotica TaxID=188477 RepID=A0A3S0Z6S3_ELYCH|nr:hypothetical protein EGW08_021610 [Elysia chlorotica]
MSLMDANYTMDEHLATRSLSLSPLPIGQGKTRRERIQFNETSEVHIEVSAEICEKPDLRYSLMLCQEEKDFVEVRRRRIRKAMKNHFGFAAPRNYHEVPVIAVIGSGGGFRAMTAYSGAFSALAQLGVLDMTTYVGGLSGSAWYLSQLYSHRQWPHEISPSAQRDELKENIDHSFLWLFKTHGLHFVKEVWKKRSRGEPVSFTDLFGHLVGNTIIKDRLDSKLSDQKQAVDQGQCPLPLYTCLHVKKSVSAMVFHEWMEFSPFEVGLPKYGTFMKSEQFGCKFFMGKIIRHFPEPPLHFLQGIWGSAFCIQFKRLFQDDKNVDSVELMRREREELRELVNSAHLSCILKRSKSTKLKQRSFWDGIVARMMESSWFQTIEVRAAQVFNFMRGLSLQNTYPISPFTKTQEEEDENNKGTFGSIFDLHPTSVKKLYVVDSGLTFNSPFPVVLRPQREVDIIISFDFSARPSDDTPPFKELLLAAKWAELNKVPFPPIDPNIIEKEGLKECYVFKHPWDPNCPIVLHFCLVNVNFRREISPGVPRTTQEEIDFGNFAIFDDPARPYSTFKFTYTHQEFQRLSRLIEYNTLLCKDAIFDNISTCIKRRRRFSIRRPCTKKDIARLSLKSRSKVAELENYISMVEKVTEASQREDVSSPGSPTSSSSSSSPSPSSPSSSSLSYSASAVSSLAVANGKPYMNGANRGRRGSKEEADLNVKSKPRPISSPVRFLMELEEEQKQAKKDVGSSASSDASSLGSRLHRSAVSLKSPRLARACLISEMSKVVEEGDDDDDDNGGDEDEPDAPTKTPTVLVDKDTPKRGVLSRSRPVSASMKPSLNTERKISVHDQQDPVIISVEDTDYDASTSHSTSNSQSTNGFHVHSNSNSPTVTQPPPSPRLAKRANALTPEQRKLSEQFSIERSLSTSDPEAVPKQSNSGELDQGMDMPDFQIKLLNIDERVTDL